MRMFPTVVGLMLLGWMLLPTQPLAAQANEGSSESLVVFLVRHAEKTDGGRDPELSESGQSRAAQLASMLRDAKISAVHSTNFRRTRDTAGPFAAQAKLEVKSYDPRKMQAFADQLRKEKGRHLVVGHSNTTPGLVKMLGGEPGEPIDESEYNRLYMVTVDDQGKVATVLLRFGETTKK